MPIDNITPNLGLELPNASNTLDYDVLRLIAALTRIDTLLSGGEALSDLELAGTPLAPTPAPGTSTQQIATTAFVQAAVSALVNAAPGLLNTLDELAAALGDDPNFATTVSTALAAKAPLNSPALTGSPTAPTQTSTDNSTKLATTAFVKTAVAALVASAPGLLDTLDELAAALGDDPNFAATMTAALAAKAPSASPTLTGAIALNGSARSSVTAVAASDINCGLGNYFTKTAAGALTWTFNNAPAAGSSYSFLLELTNGGIAAQTWPTSVKWPQATAPTLSAAGVDVLGFLTDDGGATWRGVLLMGGSA